MARPTSRPVLRTVTGTLSGVKATGSVDKGPYFTKMVITGHGLRTFTDTYTVSRFVFEGKNTRMAAG